MMNESQQQSTSEEGEPIFERTAHADNLNTLENQDFQPESGAVDVEQVRSSRASSGTAHVEANDKAPEEA